MEDNFKSESLCINGRTSLQINLDYALDFMRIYSPYGFFGFMMLNEYSHDSHKNLPFADADLLTFLRSFHSDKSISSNTILVLFADHGPRFSSHRKTIRGLLNERNPFVSVYIPPEFKNRFPNEWKVFNENTRKLITPMDLHQTMFDVLNLQKEGHTQHLGLSRAQSLFRPISGDRTCFEAGVENHWCGCLKRVELKIDTVLVEMADWFVKTHLNEVVLSKHFEKCHRLVLHKVNRVYLQESSIEPSKVNNITKPSFISSMFAIKKWFAPSLLTPPPIEYDYQQFLFQIETRPNKGLYEFTLTNEFDLNKFENKFSVNEKSVSRIDKYGNSSWCIFKSHPDLRQFCYCKNLL
jgi:hypothetical protein